MMTFPAADGHSRLVFELAKKKPDLQAAPATKVTLPDTVEGLVNAIIALDEKYEKSSDAVRDTSIQIDRSLGEIERGIAGLERENKNDTRTLRILGNLKAAIADLRGDLLEAEGEFALEATTQRSVMFSRLAAQSVDIIHENRKLEYSEIDQRCKKRTGKSFYEYCSDDGMLDGIVRDENEFRQKFHQYVSHFYVGNYSKEIALFSAFAEEANFEEKTDGTLAIKEFAGMNTPHAIVLLMLNELLAHVTMDAQGNLHGKGQLKVDRGSTANSTAIEIDFDRRTIKPPLLIQTAIVTNAKKEFVTFDNVLAFINFYIKKDGAKSALFIRKNGKFSFNPKRGSERAMNVFLNTANPLVLRHEFQHALYDNDVAYRKKIIDRVKSSSEEEREYAVLFTGCGYDIFDPDAEKVTKDIVVDEAYNAYANSDKYDYKTGQSSLFTINRFCEANNLQLSLASFHKLDELNISEQEKKKVMEAKNLGYPNESMERILRSQPDLVFRRVGNFKLLRRLIRKQHPGFYRKVQTARTKLVDWVDQVA